MNNAGKLPGSISTVQNCSSFWQKNELSSHTNYLLYSSRLKYPNAPSCRKYAEKDSTNLVKKLTNNLLEYIQIKQHQNSLQLRLTYLTQKHNLFKSQHFFLKPFTDVCSRVNLIIVLVLVFQYIFSVFHQSTRCREQLIITTAITPRR